MKQLFIWRIHYVTCDNRQSFEGEKTARTEDVIAPSAKDALVMFDANEEIVWTGMTHGGTLIGPNVYLGRTKIECLGPCEVKPT